MINSLDVLASASVPTNIESSNWSGAVITASSGEYFSDVSSTWVVPTLSQVPLSGVTISDIAEWVGIDGYNSADVCQAGVLETVQTAANGQTTISCSAFVEWYPASADIISASSFQINPGDTIEVTVETTGAGATKATFILDNLTTGQIYDVSLTAPAGTSLQGNSAEFIVETPEVTSGGTTSQPILSDFLNSPVVLEDVSATYSSGLSASLSSAQSIGMWTEDVPGSQGSSVQEAYGSIQAASDTVTVTEDDYWGSASTSSAPTLTAVVDSPSTGELTAGKTVIITIDWNEVVTVAGGVPTLSLNDGGIATYTGGSGSDALTFSYTITASNTNVTSLVVTAINPNGATIEDAAGDSASLSLVGVTQTGPQIYIPPSPAQIDEVYQAVLQHLPTSAELNAAVAYFSTFGFTGGTASVVDSPEAQYNVYPIVQIIELATGSLPTAGQLAGWVPYVESAGLLQSQSQTNPLLDQMAEAFVASTMFGDTYNGGTAVDPDAPITASIVSAIIDAATGVAATQAQVNAWVSTGQTIDQVFVEFALGDQYTAHLQSTVQQYLTTAADTAVGGGALGAVSTSTPKDGLTATQVQEAYQAVLQRAATGGEIDAALSVDGTIGNVAALAAVVDSPEAQYNVYPIVQIIELATGSLPTVGQLAGWVPYVESAGLLQGPSQTNPLLDQMAEAFVASAMFGDTYNGGTAVDPNAPITASIVSAIIQAATGVAATQAQINTWVSTGQTIDQVFVNFALGDQYTAYLQSTVQADLTAAAINGAGLSTVDGTNATGTLTLGTLETPLMDNDLTVLGGAGSLTVVASGNGDTITQLDTSTAGGVITASGNDDTISTANGANTIIATGANDIIKLGVVSTGTSITSAQTIHAAGAGDVITFATTAVDDTAVTWAAASTVDGGSGTTGIGANSTVKFGNNAGGGSETVVVTGDLTGATTSGGTSIAGIGMITLGNVVDNAGDQIVFNNATTEILAGSANVSAATSLAHAFDMAAADAAASHAGSKIAANTGVIDWFQYSGNTYVLEAVNDTGSSAAHTALAAADEIIKIIGSVSLSSESLAAHTMTL